MMQWTVVRPRLGARPFDVTIGVFNIRCVSVLKSAAAHTTKKALADTLSTGQYESGAKAQAHGQTTPTQQE